MVFGFDDCNLVSPSSLICKIFMEGDWLKHSDMSESRLFVLSSSDINSLFSGFLDSSVNIFALSSFSLVWSSREILKFFLQLYELFLDVLSGISLLLLFSFDLHLAMLSDDREEPGDFVNDEKPVSSS